MGGEIDDVQPFFDGMAAWGSIPDPTSFGKMPRQAATMVAAPRLNLVGKIDIEVAIPPAD
jgi:hypothetical protein